MQVFKKSPAGFCATTAEKMGRYDLGSFVKRGVDLQLNDYVEIASRQACTEHTEADGTVERILAPIYNTVSYQLSYTSCTVPITERRKYYTGNYRKLVS